MIRPFILHQPDSLEAACALLERYGEDAKILAGGSELVLLLKLELMKARHIIDIKAIQNRDDVYFDREAGLLRIGGLVTHRTLETSETMREHFPLLVDMEQQVANVRIRNVGTIGGNLCFAEPHADPGTLLMAYKAKVKLHNTKRERTLEISDFFVDYYETALEEGEILTEIEVPKLGENFTGIYSRFCPGERPMVGVALLIGWKNGSTEDVRLSLGCVGPKPLRATEVEESLIEKSADEVSAKAVEIGVKAALLCDPVDDIWGSREYKRQIVKTLVIRSLKELCQRKTGHE